jgi:acetyl esterase/lipase
LFRNHHGGNLIKPLILAICVVLVFGDLRAQGDVWQPSPGHRQIPIWPEAAPDAQPVPGPEYCTVRNDSLAAGKPWVAVGDVSRPTMTVYPPKGKNRNVAVVVFPGGGYDVLAIDLEGTEVCDWLASRGITAVLLKYRVPGSGPHYDPQLDRLVVPKISTALEDAQRTVGLLRFHAAEWHIDPNKIGVLGFSAGGHLAAAISTHFKKRLYPAVDGADKESCRPDFAVVLYPGHLWVPGEKFGLVPDIQANITRRTPPTFLLQAKDDPVDDVNNSLVYDIALKKAGVPVEMHLYAHGGHAFGLRRKKYSITRWPQLVEAWLGTIGMVSEQAQ